MNGTPAERRQTIVSAVVDHYDDEGELVRIDGHGTPEEVWEALHEEIEAAT